jgi:para-nitrobenzyl esterase
MYTCFQAPQPAEPWEGIRDALKEGDVAPQTGVFQDKSYSGVEDCLFINVFTPKVTKWNNWANDFP